MEKTRKQISFPTLIYPPLREAAPRVPRQWLEGKRLTDGAEGLWRVHDKLYDLRHFAARHPGGRDWIELTEGTDITEAFETHHLRGDTAERLLVKHYVRDAVQPRNSPFTFRDDGFYRQLKKDVVNEIAGWSSADIAAQRARSDRVTDLCLAAVVVLTPLATHLLAARSVLAVPAVLLAGGALSCLTVCAHNYMHRADSWRMYLGSLAGFNCREMRITHALSHHLHTNTAEDLELSMLEPFLHYMPHTNKTLFARLAVLYFPAIWMFVSIGFMVKGYLFNGAGGRRLIDLLPLALPTYMWLTSGCLPEALCAWILTMITSSIVFLVVGLTAGHHSNTNFFDGDVPRSQTPDWGAHQLDVVEERAEYAGKHALSLTRFGDHALHHLFPTLDHALLGRLYPLLARRAEAHGLKLRTTSLPRALVSQSRQLVRHQPHDFSSKPPQFARA